MKKSNSNNLYHDILLPKSHTVILALGDLGDGFFSFNTIAQKAKITPPACNKILLKLFIDQVVERDVNSKTAKYNLTVKGHEVYHALFEMIMILKGVRSDFKK